MKRGPSGTFETTAVGGERVRAFVPHDLPPDPPVAMTPARQRLHEHALLACGRLDALSTVLPEPGIFLYAYVRREALLSSQIEGTQSSLSDLLLHELDQAPGVPIDDVAEVSNYVAALEHGVGRLRAGDPLTNRLLREIHAELLASGRGAQKTPGEYRRSQNWIGGTRPGNAEFVPPPPHLVAPCMAALERFLNGDAPVGSLVKAGLAHAQFETIHPFLDGNGRAGRLLIALTLHHEGVLLHPLLYLSLYLKRHRSEYYRLLNAVRTDGAWEAWLDFFLDGVRETATGAVATAQRLLDLFQTDSARVRGLTRATGSALRVLDALRSRPVTTLGRLEEACGLSYPTVARSIDALRGLGIVREITGRRRRRVFAYYAYLHILSEGTEPL